MMVSAMEANANLDDPLHGNTPSDDSLKLQYIFCEIEYHFLYKSPINCA